MVFIIISRNTHTHTNDEHNKKNINTNTRTNEQKQAYTKHINKEAQKLPNEHILKNKQILSHTYTHKWVPLMMPVRLLRI